MSPRRMQGELGANIFVAAVAVAVVGFGIAAVANSSDDTADTTVADADYDMACVDHAGNHVEDAKCGNAPQDYDSDVLAPSVPYGYVYVPTRSVSAIVIPPVGQRMPVGSFTFRTPTVTRGSGGSVRAPVIQRAPDAGGKAVPASNGSIQRNGFGVKSGTGSGSSSKGGGGTAKGGTSSGS